MISKLKPLSKFLILILVLSLLAIPAAALADWDPDDPCGPCYNMHFPQTPDLAAGLSVDVMGDVNRVADDFTCTDNVPITDIHIWGMYLDGTKCDPAIQFEISIWTDTPGSPATQEWARSFVPGEYTERMYATVPPGSDYIQYGLSGHGVLSNSSEELWQYNFQIPAAEAFTPVTGETYWLVVMAVGDGCDFGWYTAENHWGNYAMHGQPPYDPPSWSRIAGIGFNILDIDMAFVITSETGTIILHKETIPDGSTETFNVFDENDVLKASLHDNDYISNHCLPPGTYTWHEDVPPCWSLTNVVFEDPNDNSSYDQATGIITFELDPYETITAHLENTQLGNIIVEKQTEPDGSSAVFGFSGIVNGSRGDGGQLTNYCLLPGSYTVTESAMINWKLVDIDILEDKDADSTYELGTRTVFFELNPGENITAIFTNRYVPPEKPPSEPPEGAPVGIDVYPVDKFGLLAPWIALTIAVVAGGILLLIRRKAHS
jgi:hypothetical protein